jgi:hypothetical protein
MLHVNVMQVMKWRDSLLRIVCFCGSTKRETSATKAGRMEANGEIHTAYVLKTTRNGISSQTGKAHKWHKFINAKFMLSTAVYVLLKLGIKYCVRISGTVLIVH